MTKSSQLLLPKGFFITGTDTGIGKTVVTAYLLNLFKKHGVRIGAMKPVETGIDGLSPSDAEFLIQAGGLDDPLEDVAPYRLKTKAAPQVAAIMEKVSIEYSNIQEKFVQLSQKYETLLVEGVGGLLVPLWENYLVADLAKELNLPLIIVTHPNLGSINHTLLTLESAKTRGLKVHGIIVNEYRETEDGNVQSKSLEILQNYSCSPLIGRLPYIPQLSFESFDSKTFNKLEVHLSFKVFGVLKPNATKVRE